MNKFRINHTVALVGASGFLGKEINSVLTECGYIVKSISAPRLLMQKGGTVYQSAITWTQDNPQGFSHLVEQFKGTEVVVNAAGISDAVATRSAALYGANALLPGVLLLAAQQANAHQFVHISSAAVGGTCAVLTETLSHGARTPYALSKALAETALLEEFPRGNCKVVVFRPGSVLGPGRPIMRQLRRVLMSPILLAPRNGNVPIPVSTVQEVARSIPLLLVEGLEARIINQPYDGYTVASLAKEFGRVSKIWSINQTLAKCVVEFLRLFAAVPFVAANGNRLSLLWLGQRQQSSLPDIALTHNAEIASSP